MINVLVHNLATGVFMNDGVILNNPVIPTDTAAARLRKALGLTFEDAVISISTIGDFLGFMSAFPWIEEIINPEDWDNKTYIPSRLTPNTYARDIGTNKNPSEVLAISSNNSISSTSQIHNILSIIIDRIKCSRSAPNSPCPIGGKILQSTVPMFGFIIYS